MIRNGIGETNATLEIGGRNVKEKILNLSLDTTKMLYSLNEENMNDDIPYEVGSFVITSLKMMDILEPFQIYYNLLD